MSMNLGTVSFERTVFLKLREEVAHHCAADHPTGFLCGQPKPLWISDLGIESLFSLKGNSVYFKFKTGGCVTQ